MLPIMVKCMILSKVIIIFVGSNMSEKPASCIPVLPTPLTFPSSRSVLWDHRHIGPPAAVNIADCRLVYINLEFRCVIMMQKTDVLLVS